MTEESKLLLNKIELIATIILDLSMPESKRLCWGCQKVRVKAALAAERGE